jgi:hypothetical protein
VAVTESKEAGEFNFVVENEDGIAFLVTRKTAHEQCPQAVIKFYEDHFEWLDGSKNKKIKTEEK